MVNYSKYRLADLNKLTFKIGIRPLDIMITGPTGVGKSTTLNALFGYEVARPGMGTDPETMTITEYWLNDFIRFWDTPGLGDTPEKDKRHRALIKSQLRAGYGTSSSIYKIIDLVLVICDASARDLGTTYNLIENVILPEISSKRVLLAINKADFALSGRHFDKARKIPDSKLEERLVEQRSSFKNRIEGEKKLYMPEPVTFSAEYDYNITGVLDLIINNAPTKRRK